MTANELRIGNYIHFDNFLGMKYDYQVTPRFFRSLALDSTDCLEIEINGFHQPIPLTEEWLIKFGFEKASKNHWNVPESFLDEIGFTSSWFYILRKEGKYFIPYRWERQVTGDRYMRYVHQLQNIYHALTGNELPFTVSASA